MTNKSRRALPDLSVSEFTTQQRIVKETKVSKNEGKKTEPSWEQAGIPLHIDPTRTQTKIIQYLLKSLTLG